MQQIFNVLSGPEVLNTVEKRRRISCILATIHNKSAVTLKKSRRNLENIEVSIIAVRLQPSYVIYTARLIL